MRIGSVEGARFNRRARYAALMQQSVAPCKEMQGAGRLNKCVSATLGLIRNRAMLFCQWQAICGAMSSAANPTVCWCMGAGAARG
jgi:hypothetical protein